MAAVFLALKPVFARMILDKTKSFELRRGRSSIASGDRLYLYSSSPEKSLVGIATVRRVIIGSVETVERAVAGAAGVSRREFLEYCGGRLQVTALELSEVTACREAMTLMELRSILPAFVIPQSYRFLNAAEAEALLSSMPAPVEGSRLTT